MVVFNFLSLLFMNSYILYKLTFRNPKSRLEFIKDVIDSLASESKAIVLCAHIKKRMFVEEVKLYIVHAKRVFMHYVFKDISACN